MTAISTMLAGTGIGACVALALYVLAVFTEVLSGNAVPGWFTFLSILPFFTIAGTVIGLISGIYKMKVASDKEARRRAAADSEEAKQQRIKWADEVKKKALSVANICDKNAKAYNALIVPIYKADAQMDAIIGELANAAELKGKIDAMANDIKSKGGISE